MIGHLCQRKQEHSKDIICNFADHVVMCGQGYFRYARAPSHQSPILCGAENFANLRFYHGKHKSKY